jgi:1-phosphofructokinase
MSPAPRITVFAPNPVLTVTLERQGSDRDTVHFHAGGQGVWVARTAGVLGALPVLCGLLGGESGALLRGLLDRLPGERRLVPSAAPSGCLVTDRRSGERRVLSVSMSEAPSRHELDDLFSRTCAEAIDCGWLVLTNPLPGDALPLELYRDLIADVRASGTRVLVDLSSPRLDSALESEPELVKLNDWELAEYVCGPVSGPALLTAAQRLRDRGAGTVVVTRAEQPALVLSDGGTSWLKPPRFERGFREGCGDAMLGGIVASWAGGASLEDSLVTGAAAGAANFLRHGIAGASREVIEGLRTQVVLEPVDALTMAG